MPTNFSIGDREIGDNHPPLVIAEIGINHDGNFEKAKQMVNDAYENGISERTVQSHESNLESLSPLT